MKQQKNLDKKKILIFLTEHIGDYAISLNGLKAIRENFPHAKIDLVIGSCNKDLAKITPYIDNIILFNDPFIKRNLSYFSILKSFFSFKTFNFLRSLDKKKYDLVISFSNRKLRKFLLKFISSKNKIEGTDFEFGDLNQKTKIKKILESRNIKVSDTLLRLNYSNKEKSEVDDFLKSYKLKKKSFFILHPISPLSEKNWSLSNWFDSFEEVNSKIIVIGDDKVKPLINKFLSSKNNKFINTAGNFNLAQITYLISQSKGFFGVDSGPMHLARLSKTPITVLFGPTNEKVWGPKKEEGLVIKKEKMSSIRPSDVKFAIKRLYKKP